MPREILPNRPLRVLPRFRNNRITVIVLLTLGIAVCSTIAISSTARELGRIADEQATWDHGEDCAGGGFTARTKSGATEISIRCETLDGRTLTGEIASNMPAGRGWFSQDQMIRYIDGDAPHFAMSAMIEHIPGRRGYAFGYGGMLALFALGFTAMLLVPARKLLALRRLAREGDEVEVAIEKIDIVRRGKIDTDYRIVHWRTRSGRRRSYKTKMDCRNGLAWTHATESRALALRSKNGKQAILLPATFAPFALTDAERADAAAKLEANGGGMARGPITMVADWIVLTPPAPAPPPTV